MTACEKRERAVTDITSNQKKAGLWSGSILFALGLCYLGLVAAMVSAGSGYPPVEPYQTIFNCLILLTASCVLVFWVALYKTMPAQKGFYGACSLSMIIIFTALTSINRYVGLTVVRQSIISGQIDNLHWFMPYGWPSVTLAIEMLAWGVFFGAGCIFLSFTFGSGKLERTIKGMLLAIGSLCILSAVGPIVGGSQARLQVFTAIGMIGWGPGLTVAVLLVVFWFRKQSVSE